MKSKLLILFFLLVSVIIVFNEDKGSHNQFNSDKCGYYLYLPATFIYHDLQKLSFYPQLDSEYHKTLGVQQSLYDVNGNKLNKYPCGVSLFEFPFFLAANSYCKVTSGHPADGFSMPYQLAGIFSNIFWVVLGLIILRSFLKRYFNDNVIAITLFLIAFGTNLYTYTAFEVGMSHPYSFFLFCSLLYLTDELFRVPSNKLISVLIGLVLGLIFIVRPINIIAAIIPLFWKVSSLSALKQRVGYWRKHFTSILIAIPICILVAFIQFAYWKYLTGHWLYYSYQGEGFDFIHPHILDGLFSYRKGWFVYTPMSLVGLVGFYFLWKKHRDMVPVLVVFFALFIYGVFSWCAWWYGGGFGCRPLIEAVAFLSMPLAAMVEYFSGIFSNIKKVVFFAITLLIVALNVFQSYQYSMGLLYWDRMTKEYYWKIFGQTDAKRDGYEKLLMKEGEEGDLGK